MSFHPSAVIWDCNSFTFNRLSSKYWKRGVYGHIMGDATDLKGIKPGLFWGWYVVLGAFLILAINYGARYSFGVFVKPMAAQYNWSRSAISAGMSIMVLAYGIR